MAEIKKYLDQAAAQELVTQIKAEDAKVLDSAKSYADSLAPNYDAAGSANQAKLDAIADADAKFATVNENLGKKADTTALESEIARAKAAEEANAAAAKKAQDEVDALELVVQNIQENAYDDTEIRDLISGLDENKADKTQVATDIAAAVKVETDARVEAVAGVQSAVDTLAGTHATDKKALEDAIALKADQTAVDEAIAAEKERAEGIESSLESRLATVEGDYLKKADKEELQGKIDAVDEALEVLTEGIDAEKVDGVKDLITYVEEHGTEVTGMKADIKANADAIAEEVARSTGKDTELEAAIATKVAQADYNAKVAALEGEDTAIKGRLDDIEAQLGDGEGSVADLIADAKQEAIEAAAEDATIKANAAEAAAKGHADSLNTAMNTRVEALEAIDHEHANKAELDLIATGDKAKWDAAAGKAHEHANSAELAKIADGDVAKWNAAEQNAKDYADGLNTAMTTKVDGIDGRVTVVEGAVATKAESSALTALAERVTTNETNIAANTSAINAFVAYTPEEIRTMFA